MFIQINTDNHVDTSSDQNARLEEQVRQRLARFEGRITDVEIHVSDVNGQKGNGGELRCTLEARVNGYQPVAVAETGATLDRCVVAAAKKAVRALDHKLGKLSDPIRH